MSPLIDVIFQLLIFFMLSSSFVMPALRLALPEAQVADSSDNPEIVISVDEKGAFYVNTERVALSDLREKLRPLVAKSKTKVVTFRGDRSMRYEAFVDALDASKLSGAARIDIVHQPKQ